MVLLSSCTTQATPGPTPVTVPALTTWTPAPGKFEFTSDTTITADEAVRAEARTFAADLAEVVGRQPEVTSAGTIALRLDPARTELGDEGYTLDVGTAVTITGRTPTGVFYGTRTVLQMLRAGRTIHAGKATDLPRYPERGAGMCACAVHVSTESLHRLLKDMAYLKLNHLWLELKVRSDTHPETVSWSYYTKQEITELQALAKQYHVTLIPEVDAPGHMKVWLRNRPDLQLADDPNALDIAKPEALTFVTSLIDEYLTVFDTPYWHLGADEYPAVSQDAFVTFVNKVNAHVRAKNKQLRIWNDGITGAATVELDQDILVEHWKRGLTPADELIANGHQVMNAAEALYFIRGGRGMDLDALWTAGWTPQSFEDGKIAESQNITGAKITAWPDAGAGETENEMEARMLPALRFIAQTTWGKPHPDPDFATFTSRAKSIGRAPNLPSTTSASIEDGVVRLAVNNGFLNSDLVASETPEDWRLTRTPDGYHTIQHAATGTCLETRLGERQLGVPLEAGTPITLEQCAPDNRLQRWQLTTSGSRVTLTNAITRMIALLDDVLRQDVPQGHTPATFTIQR